MDIDLNFKTWTAGADLSNTLVLPFHIYARLTGHKIRIVPDRYVPDDHIYCVDKDGKVMCWSHGLEIKRD